MRKTSYFATFCLVTAILCLNVISARRKDWLVVHYDEPITKIKWTTTYGLNERCDTANGAGGRISYHECRRFPTVKDDCDDDKKNICAAWTSAVYLDQISIGFSAVSLVAILFGVSTHSRRRRIWAVVGGLLLLQAACQIVTFGVITEIYNIDGFPSFDRARPGVGYILHTIVWIQSVLVAFGVFLTGLSAKAGHQWAAGNRAYQPIR